MITNTFHKISNFANDCKISINESINQSATKAKDFLKDCKKILDIFIYIFSPLKKENDENFFLHYSKEAIIFGAKVITLSTLSTLINTGILNLNILALTGITYLFLRNIDKIQTINFSQDISDILSKK